LTLNAGGKKTKLEYKPEKGSWENKMSEPRKGVGPFPRITKSQIKEKKGGGILLGPSPGGAQKKTKTVALPVDEGRPEMALTQIALA